MRRRGTVLVSVANQIFPDHDPRAMNAGLDAFAASGRARPRSRRSTIPRYRAAGSPRDNARAMTGWRAKDRCEDLRDAHAPGAPLRLRPAHRPCRSSGARAEGRRAVRPQTATPRTTSPPAACRRAGTAAAAFPEPHRRCRPRGNCAPRSGGRRAGPLISATPARRRRRPAPLRSARDRSGLLWPAQSWRRQPAADHGAHRAKSEESGRDRDRSGAGDQIARCRARTSPSARTRSSRCPRRPASPAPSPANSCDRT